ncbi:MAG: hypothetical protein V7740_16065 [Pseudomonas marincola]
MRFKLTTVPFGVSLALFIIGAPFLSSAERQGIAMPQILEGRFLNATKPSVISVSTIRHSDVDSLLIKIAAKKPHEIELIGEVIALDLCFSEKQNRDNVRVGICDSGNGGNCREEYVFFDSKTDALMSYTLTELAEIEEMEDVAGEKPFCDWEFGRDAAVFFGELLDRWSPKKSKDYFSPFAEKTDRTFSMPIIKLDPADVASSLLEFSLYSNLEVETQTLIETEKWKLSSITGSKICDSAGVIIAHNKSENTFTSLYHIASGCSKTFNFPPNSLTINGDVLVANFCTDCEWWGEWSRYNWNLNTHKVSREPNTK